MANPPIKLSQLLLLLRLLLHKMNVLKKVDFLEEQSFWNVHSYILQYFFLQTCPYAMLHI